MQNSTSSPGAVDQPGRTSNRSEGDHGIESKPTTATIKRKHRARQPSYRPDLTANPRATARQDKSYAYAAPVSGRESWWRITIKVGQVNIEYLTTACTIFLGYS